MKTRYFSAVILFVFMIMSIGCKVELNQNVQDLIYEEAGYWLASYGLEKSKVSDIDRTKKSVEIVLAMFGKKDVNDILNLVVTYVEEAPQFKPTDREQRFYKRAMNLLSKLLKVDMEIPENQLYAANMLKAFLNGALQGIQDL
jgi:hypothetical protein